MSSRRHTPRNILDLDREAAIAATRALPVYARVYWDFDKDAWALECLPCNRRLVWPSDKRTTDRQVKEAFLKRAEQHNEEYHA